MGILKLLSSWSEYADSGVIRNVSPKLLSILQVSKMNTILMRNSVIRKLCIKLAGRVCTAILSSRMEHEHHTDSIEPVVELLLGGLSDKDTIVRWSASKGIGKILRGLSEELRVDVIDVILDLLVENSGPESGTIDYSLASDKTWHGSLLALAELARRQLLPVEKLPEAIDWAIKVRLNCPWYISFT